MERATIASHKASACRPRPSGNLPRAGPPAAPTLGARPRPTQGVPGMDQGGRERSRFGSLPLGATPDGVLDLAGNVHEWTSSIARAYPYRPDDREDPDRVADRVVRGGAADTGPETLRSAWRGANVSRRATAGHHNIGFRCAKDAQRLRASVARISLRSIRATRSGATRSPHEAQ